MTPSHEFYWGPITSEKEQTLAAWKEAAFTPSLKNYACKVNIKGLSLLAYITPSPTTLGDGELSFPLMPESGYDHAYYYTMSHLQWRLDNNRASYYELLFQMGDVNYQYAQGSSTLRGLIDKMGLKINQEIGDLRVGALGAAFVDGHGDHPWHLTAFISRTKWKYIDEWRRIRAFNKDLLIPLSVMGIAEGIKKDLPEIEIAPLNFEELKRTVVEKSSLCR